MHKLAAEAVRQHLTQEHKDALKVYDDLRALDDLAKESTVPECCEHPVYFDNAPCYPMTLSKLTWLADVGSQIGAEYEEACLLYAVSLPALPDEDWSPAHAKKSVHRFARKCKWTPRSMTRIVELRFAFADQDADASDTGGPSVVAFLAHNYGGDPAWWLTAPIDLIEQCIAQWNQDQEAQYIAHMKVTKGKGVTAAATITARTLRRLRERCKKIKEGATNGD